MWTFTQGVLNPVQDFPDGISEHVDVLSGKIEAYYKAESEKKTQEPNACLKHKIIHINKSEVLIHQFNLLDEIYNRTTTSNDS